MAAVIPLQKSKFLKMSVKKKFRFLTPRAISGQAIKVALLKVEVEWCAWTATGRASSPSSSRTKAGSSSGNQFKSLVKKTMKKRRQTISRKKSLAEKVLRPFITTISIKFLDF